MKHLRFRRRRLVDSLHLAGIAANSAPAAGLTVTNTDDFGVGSLRQQVLTDDNVLIGGCILPGISSKRVIVRAIGPSLTAFGVPGALMDPALEFHAPDDFVTTNDNWKDDQQAEIEATGLAPTNDAESAIVQTLIPGAYTVIVRGVNGTTGVGLVEAYDLNQLGDSRLANISVRGALDTTGVGLVEVYDLDSDVQ
jgi:hypothetical protein